MRRPATKVQQKPCGQRYPVAESAGHSLNRIIHSLAASHPVLAAIPIEDRKQLLQQAESKTYQTSQWVLPPGATLDSLIYITDGELHVFYGDHLIGAKGPQDSIGVLPVLARTNHRLPVSVLCTADDTKILLIAEQVLDDVLMFKKNEPPLQDYFQKLEAQDFILRFWFQDMLIPYPMTAAHEITLQATIKSKAAREQTSRFRLPQKNSVENIRQRALDFERSGDTKMAIFSHEERIRYAIEAKDMNEEYLARFDLAKLFEKCALDSKDDSLLGAAKECVTTIFDQLSVSETNLLLGSNGDAIRHATAVLLRRLTLQDKSPKAFLEWAQRCMDIEQTLNLVPEQTCSQVSLADGFEATGQFDESLKWRRAHLLSLERATQSIFEEKTELGYLAAYLLSLAHSALASTLTASALYRLNNRRANALKDYQPVATSKFPVTEQLSLYGPRVTTELVTKAKAHVVRHHGEEVLIVGSMDADTDDDWMLVQKLTSDLQGFVPTVYLRVCSDRVAMTALKESLEHLQVQIMLARSSGNKLLEWCAFMQRGWVFQTLHRAEQGTKPFSIQAREEQGLEGGPGSDGSYMVEAQTAIFTARDLAISLIDFEARRFTMNCVRRLQSQRLPTATMRLELLQHLRRACPSLQSDPRALLIT